VWAGTAGPKSRAFGDAPPVTGRSSSSSWILGFFGFFFFLAAELLRTPAAEDGRDPESNACSFDLPAAADPARAGLSGGVDGTLMLSPLSRGPAHQLITGGKVIYMRPPVHSKCDSPRKTKPGGGA
jgi:hypothetical protein